MENILRVLETISFGELFRSDNIEMIDAARRYFESTEEFEKCALLRDRILDLKLQNVKQGIIDKSN